MSHPKLGSKNRVALDTYLTEKAKNSPGTNSTKKIKPSFAPQGKARSRRTNREGLTSGKSPLSLVRV
jgi:hypothetical protein